jgi:hypothetical protein
MTTYVRPRDSVGENSAGLDYVFVSYSRWDQPYVGRLAASLSTAGIPSWTSGPGRHSPAWRNEVFPNIADCTAVLVVMTPRSWAADGVAQEIAYAESLQKVVIPIAVDGYCFPAMPRQLTGHGDSRMALFLEQTRFHAAGHINPYSEMP